MTPKSHPDHDLPTDLSKEKIQKMLWTLIKHKSKFQIFNLFEMFGRMSLTELAERLHKSKSTIHSHLKFFLKLGLVEKSKEALDRNPNVYENYYNLVENYEAFFQNLDFEFKPFQPLTADEIKTQLEPAISYNRMLKSYYETVIKFLQALEKSGVDEEAVQNYNHLIQWYRDDDGNPQMISRNINSNSFYSETAYFKEIQKVFQVDYNFDVEEQDFQEMINSSPDEKPMLIIKSAIPYGHMIKYLNKQKHKSYQVND